MRTTTEMRRTMILLALVAAAAALAVASSGALAAEASEEERGADLLSAIERGDSSCSDLSGADLMAVGEFAMGRMVGSPAAHERIDRMMASMMGEDALDRIHRAMGARYAGCGDSRLPGSFDGMIGMMGMMGGGFGPGGMMGGGFGPGGIPGGMMGAGGFARGGMIAGNLRDGDDDGVDAWVAIVLLLLVAGAASAVFLTARPGRREDGPAPLELLAQRLARGEIGVEEYAERRRLLEGDGR